VIKTRQNFASALGLSVARSAFLHNATGGPPRRVWPTERRLPHHKRSFSFYRIICATPIRFDVCITYATRMQHAGFNRVAGVSRRLL